MTNLYSPPKAIPLNRFSRCYFRCRKLNCPYRVYRDVGKINVYGFRFRRGGFMKTRKLWAPMLLASLAIVLQLSSTARAQDEDEDQPQNDPPARVGRLDYSHGSVSFRPAGEDDWVTAVPNRPMVTGDDLWADEDSRAEVDIGSTALRLGSKTGITFLTLDDRTTQIRLAQGSLILRVRHLDDDDSYEVDTPNIAFTLLQPGEYRINVSEDGSESIT